MDMILVVTKPFDWCVQRRDQTLSRHSSQESAYKAALDYASALFEDGVQTQVAILPEARSFAGRPEDAPKAPQARRMGVGPATGAR